MKETERLAVDAIIELQAKINKQEQINQKLWAKNEDLEKKLDQIEQIVASWNNDASHSFEDMCKINGIIKQK